MLKSLFVGVVEIILNGKDTARLVCKNQKIIFVMSLKREDCEIMREDMYKRGEQYGC